MRTYSTCVSYVVPYKYLYCCRYSVCDYNTVSKYRSDFELKHLPIKYTICTVRVPVYTGDYYGSTVREQVPVRTGTYEYLYNFDRYSLYTYGHTSTGSTGVPVGDNVCTAVRVRVRGPRADSTSSCPTSGPRIYYRYEN